MLTTVRTANGAVRFAHKPNRAQPPRFGSPHEPHRDATVRFVGGANRRERFLRCDRGMAPATTQTTTPPGAHNPPRDCNIAPYSRNTLSLSCLHTKMTTTLIPIPDDAYGRSNLLFSLKKAITCCAASLKDTGHWSTQFTQKLEASFHSKTAQSRFRNMNADYGRVRSRAELHHHKTQTA